MTSPHGAPALDHDLPSEVAEVLRDHLEARRVEIERIAPEAGELVDVLRGYLEGGKLLRPRFCLWGGAAVRIPGRSERAGLAAFGAAIELVQAAALLHDDVMDHSPTRRGRPAAHVAQARRHRDAGLAGDSGDYGESFAIILGDLALSWANDLASTAVPGAQAAAREFELLRTEVMTGQFLDILHQSGGFASRPEPAEAALAVIRWKTVPYTVLRPLRMGATLMGADAAQLDVLTRYAEAAGRGFQLRDDLLGALGDEATSGKSGTTDISEGKRTLLLALTEEAAVTDDRAVLTKVVGREDAAPDEVAAVQALMRRTGAARAVAERIAEDAQLAIRIVEEAEEITPEARDGLRELARAATDLTGIPVD